MKIFVSFLFVTFSSLSSATAVGRFCARNLAGWSRVDVSIAATESSVTEAAKQLGDDFAWLGNTYGTFDTIESAAYAYRLQFAASNLRNVLVPFSRGHHDRPLNIAVVGGASAGKSTIVNLLLGEYGANANPQSGFTRIPVAYTHAQDDLNWKNYPDFLSPLSYDPRSELSEDQDSSIYLIRRRKARSARPIDPFVVWDLPDMTTNMSSSYIGKMLEVAGMADIVVYVASAERYNDKVPTRFLQLFSEAGKPVLVVMNKLTPDSAEQLRNHFTTTIGNKLPNPPIAVLSVPHFRDWTENTFAKLPEVPLPDDFVLDSRMPSELNATAVFRLGALLTKPAVDHVKGRPIALRGSSSVKFLKFLNNRTTTAEDPNSLLHIAKRDLDHLQLWHDLVEAGRVNFVDRYKKEIVDSQKYAIFDAIMVRLTELLRLPYVGTAISMPKQLLGSLAAEAKSYWRDYVSGEKDEDKILRHAAEAWLDGLQTTALLHDGPLWSFLKEHFTELRTKALAELTVHEGKFREQCNAEVEQIAQEIIKDMRQSPTKLAAIRTGRTLLDAAGLYFSIVTFGAGKFVYAAAPLSTVITTTVVDSLGGNYVDNQREKARRRHKELFETMTANVLAEFLTAYPAQGKEFKTLKMVIDRIPKNAKKVADGLGASLYQAGVK